MEVKVKIEKTLHTDNDKVFYEDEDIAFEMEKTGDKYIGRIKKIKKKSTRNLTQFKMICKS